MLSLEFTKLLDKILMRSYFILDQLVVFDKISHFLTLSLRVTQLAFLFIKVSLHIFQPIFKLFLAFFGLLKL
jgi:hypothetical protein